MREFINLLCSSRQGVSKPTYYAVYELVKNTLGTKAAEEFAACTKAHEDDPGTGSWWFRRPAKEVWAAICTAAATDWEVYDYSKEYEDDEEDFEDEKSGDDEAQEVQT